MEAWLAQLKKEYKNHELPEFKNEIEGISYSFIDQTTPIKGWQSRFLNTQKTATYAFHRIEDMSSARANLLHDLNHGCEGILLTWEETPDLDQLFQGIHFEYLQTVLSLPRKVDLTSVLHWMNRNQPKNLFLESGIEELAVTDQSVGYVISGFDAYSSGANAWQELAYTAHFLEQFLTVKSSRTITLEMGVGENTVMELAKFRALDWLVQAICEKIQHFPPIKIRCKTGWRNKTNFQVNDNQIRQTLEATCALLSGVHELSVTPYDASYADTSDFLVRRMALNTVHILENEAELNRGKSFFHSSLIVQHHAQWLCDRVWSVLENPNTDGFKNYLQQEIETTNQLRKQRKKQSNEPVTPVITLRDVSGVFGGNGVYFQNL